MNTSQGSADGPSKVVSEAGTEGHGAKAVLAADRLDYLADMISELRALAARAGHTTLAGLLALAYVEAKQQCGKLKP